MILWSVGLIIYVQLINAVNSQPSSPFRPPVPASRLLPGPIQRFSNELVVDPIVEETSFFKIHARNVTQWLRLTLDESFLLGVGHNDVSLVTMYKINSNNYQFHEYPIVTRYKITCAAMFKSRRMFDQKYEGIVLLGLQSPQPSVAVYRIQHFKLYHITDWNMKAPVQALSHFKWRSEDRVIIFQELKNVTQVEVYGFEFEPIVPHIWHLETMQMDRLVGQPSLGWSAADSPADTLFLATIDNKLGSVNIYDYRSVCPAMLGNKFVLALSIPDMNARKIEFFHAYGQSYMLVVGEQTVLFRITPERGLVRDTIFGYIDEMMVIPVVTTRQDTVLIGKSRDGNPHLYTLNENLWEERVTPKCQRSANFDNVVVDLKQCIGGSRSWSGATYIETTSASGTNPTLLFADRLFPGELYHITLSMRTIAMIEPLVNQNIINELETQWNGLQKSLRGSTDRVKSSSTPVVPSLCRASSQIHSMFELLSEIELHLSSTDCSSEAYIQPGEEHSIVYDEAPPVETATNTNRDSTPDVDVQQAISVNDVEPTPSKTSSMVFTAQLPENIEREADAIFEYDLKTNKAPAFSPELRGIGYGRKELDPLGKNDDISIS
ncbi:Hypothetical protein NTJ_03556 [Nesidiocoris tenuis]|uniref:Uncharacterized protein n=1 Tax=Nesidiocoris tenuis TaxID=355587 RepID=A0ABN7AEP9_9HEMI|nr:Hypothetical protein NTJ_03556 [Nesidiocoris tenuis]